MRLPSGAPACLIILAVNAAEPGTLCACFNKIGLPTIKFGAKTRMT